MSRPRGVNIKPCGTAAAYWRHRYHGEEPCPEDRAAVAKQKRERERANGAKPRRQPRHGTYSMYASFGCRCRSCLEANREYKADYNAGKRRRSQGQSTIPDLILDILETFGYPMTSDQLADHVTRIRPQFKRESVRSIASRMEGDGRLVVKEQRIEGTNRIYLYWMP